MVEIKNKEGIVFAVVDNYRNFPRGISFYGDRSDAIQVLAFNYENGHIMRDHMHIPRDRIVNKTQEAVVVFSGFAEVRTYDFEDKILDVRKLSPGDVYISYNGGVGYTVLQEGTIMAEFKVGPYEVSSDDEDRRLI